MWYKVELGISVVMRCKDGRCTLIQMPLTTPLTLSDHGTAEVAKETLQRVSEVDLRASVRSKCKADVVLTPSDAASSNLRYFAHMKEADGGQRLHLNLACEVHFLHNLTGRGLATINRFVSGLIAWTLSQQPGGCTAKLREAIEGVLFCSVRVHKAAAPKPGGPRMTPCASGPQRPASVAGCSWGHCSTAIGPPTSLTISAWRRART